MIFKIKPLAYILLIYIVAISFVVFYKIESLKISQLSPLSTTHIETELSNTNEFKIDALPFSIETIFSNIDLKNLDDEKVWTMLVTGDVMIGRTVNTQTLKANDFSWPYKNIEGFLSQFDITYINLESPIIENCPTKDSGMIFCGDIRHIKEMANQGISFANLANNHTMNYGENGLISTIDELAKNNILGVGYKNPVYYQIKDQSIAFLGYTDIECYPNTLVSCAKEEQMISELKIASENSDLVIVQFHWGDEYKAFPNNRQKYLAYLAIDNGADLVLGNHPHWIQPIEIYKEKLISYSHGNFIFDQMWSQKTREGVATEYIFYENKLIGLKFHPIIIDNYGQPRLLEGNEKQRILDEIKKDSFELIAN